MAAEGKQWKRVDSSHLNVVSHIDDEPIQLFHNRFPMPYRTERDALYKETVVVLSIFHSVFNWFTLCKVWMHKILDLDFNQSSSFSVSSFSVAPLLPLLLLYSQRPHFHFCINCTIPFTKTKNERNRMQTANKNGNKTEKKNEWISLLCSSTRTQAWCFVYPHHFRIQILCKILFLRVFFSLFSSTFVGSFVFSTP